jgi:hypothetical protein
MEISGGMQYVMGFGTAWKPKKYPRQKAVSYKLETGSPLIP